MELSRSKIIELLSAEGAPKEALFAEAAALRQQNVGPKSYLRGLIEYSNRCRKSCLYCGIRRESGMVSRYTLRETEVLEAAAYAFRNHFGSIVLQGGEITSTVHISTLERIIRRIKECFDGQLAITLSLGEQTLDTYRRWFQAGAHRYLLRIESASEALYRKIHPDDPLHRQSDRIEALNNLRAAGYQVGTGVMIGLPFQTLENLADDLLFMQRMDIDMCGMGPYLEHEQTPLYAYRALLKPLEWRLEMTLKMIAILRLLLPEINIAATTALQAIDPLGREKALRIGANVIMPNITPERYKQHYTLYQNKPVSELIHLPESEIGFREWGDSPHFGRRNRK